MQTNLLPLRGSRGPRVGSDQHDSSNLQDLSTIGGTSGEHYKTNFNFVFFLTRRPTPGICRPANSNDGNSFVDMWMHFARRRVDRRMDSTFRGCWIMVNAVLRIGCAFRPCRSDMIQSLSDSGRSSLWRYHDTRAKIQLLTAGNGRLLVGHLPLPCLCKR
jgi:hypothetical protein